MALFLQDGTPVLLQNGQPLLLQSDNLAVSGPFDQTVRDDNFCEFGLLVASNDPGSLTYQWYRDAVLIGGATNASYTFIVDLALDDGIGYYCEVTDSSGTVQSDTAILTVTKKPLVWVTDPQSQTVVDGNQVALTALADANPTVTYQWYRNAVLMGGETATTLNVTAALADTGDEYYCEATDGYGDAYNSATATLTIEEEQGLGDMDLRMKNPDGQWIRITQPIMREYTVTGDSTRTPGGVQSHSQRLVCTNTTAITVTLTGFTTGAEVQVIRADGPVTIDGDGTLINGQATQVMPLQWDAANMVLTSVGWVAV